MTEVAEPVAGEAAALQARKRDIYAAIHTLARDRDEGTVDEAAYRRARERYEQEAAAILARLDDLDTASESASPRPRRAASWPAVLIALGLVVAAVVIFLIAALRDRGAGTITGSQPPLAPSPAPAATAVPKQVRTALRQTRLHPGNLTGWLTLGNAYLDTGNPARAERAFRTAVRLAPNSPKPPTLDALALAAEGKVTPALDLLSQVEQAHPAYARAWLTDGLLAARRAPGIPRAIRAWKRFLVLQPRSPVSAEVRASLAKLEQTQRSK